jgi:hypothetical protein
VRWRILLLKLSQTLSAGLLVTLLTLNSAAFAQTTTKTYSAGDLGDLDHHLIYTWRLDNIDIDLAGRAITGASLFFDNIANWRQEENKLFVHLFDTAKNSGVRSFYDDNPADDGNNGGGVNRIVDDFTSGAFPRSDGKDARGQTASWLLNAGTADTFLFDKSFGTTPIDYTYSFTNAQVKALTTYIKNGKNIAIGFDSDCHFFNDGIKLKITTVKIPEPATGAFLLLGLGVLARRRK